MYKFIFFKFFLFVLYMTAGLVSKFHSSSQTDNEIMIREIERNNNQHHINVNNNQNNGGNRNRRPTSQDPNQIGQATLWVNPFVTRYKKPTTTKYTTTTTTTTTRRTARPRLPRLLQRRLKRGNWIT